MSNPRNTKAKQAILDEINKSPYALSQPELFDRLKGLCDRVTIYRVLDRLVLEHKIHRIVNVDGTLNYAPCVSCERVHNHSHDHLHFSCTNCKKLECLAEQQIQINLAKGYKVNELFLTISGLCPSCSIS